MSALSGIRTSIGNISGGGGADNYMVFFINFMTGNMGTWHASFFDGNNSGARQQTRLPFNYKIEKLFIYVSSSSGQPNANATGIRKNNAWAGSRFTFPASPTGYFELEQDIDCTPTDELEFRWENGFSFSWIARMAVLVRRIP